MLPAISSSSVPPHRSFSKPGPSPVLTLALAALVSSGTLAAQMTPPSERMLRYERHVQMSERSQLKSLPWQHLGPTNISGRSTDVAVVAPKGLNYTIYAAYASGGVWKTINEGVTWQPVFEHGISTSIGDIAIAPTDPDIVWIGTGEANIFRSSMAGGGIYKSTDAGETWTHMGLTGTHTIARILVHPTNPDIVWVAASGHEWTDNEERGVFKTTDGGRSWEKVFYVNPQTGAIDLVLDPGDPNTLYAAAWQRVRRKWNDPRTLANYTGSGIHKSTDGGRTWQAINNGLPAPQFRGRIGIDVARSNPNVLYAFLDSYEIARQPEAGQTDAYGRPAGPVIRGATVWRSDDKGGSWRQVSENDRYMEGASGTYGWVFGQLRVDPNDENKVFFLGLNLNVSVDGGRTWERLTGMHVDHHALWIDPANSNYMVNGNDGGVYISYDNGENWRFIEDVGTVQFFNVAYDMANPFHVYGSIQDHGSRRGIVDLTRGRDNIPAVDWGNAPGGEGSNQAIDPRNENIVYAAGFYGNISRSNLADSTSENITPRPPEGALAFRGQWLAPFMLSPHNPDVLYHGFEELHRSMDRGATWQRISNDLTRNNPGELGDIPFQTIFSISESPLGFGLIYAGTDDGRTHVTRDAGKTWTEIGTSLPAGKFIAELVASKYADGRVYMVQNGKRDDDFTPYVWVSEDYGQTWTSIAQGIPSGPVNVIKEDPKNPNLLYAGTDLSAYASLDRGQTWHALSNQLPTTFVHDIVIHPRDDIMVAATHGRGMYAMDVRPLQALTADIVQNNAVHVIPPEPARSPAGGFGRGGFGGNAPGATVHYWLRSAGPVTIEVTDTDGQVVATLNGSGDAGLNRTTWNLSRAGAAPPAGGGGRGGRGGAFVSPAVFTVEVRQGNNVSSGFIQVSR
jgi:photosystem II stability/assembly factor-like uncharacterized protein